MTHDNRFNVIICISVILLLFAAVIVGSELQALRLENAHLRADCSMKDEALTYANDRIDTLEGR